MAATQGEWKRGQPTMPLPTPIPSMEPKHGQYCPPSLSNYFSSPSLNFLPHPLPSPPTPFSSHFPLPTIVPPVKGKVTGFPNNESILFSLSRITLAPVADIFVVWARCSEDGKIRGFILEKVCSYCTSCKYGCKNTHSNSHTCTHTHVLTGYERSLCP